MGTLHITRGLPGSGKTTFAREWVAQDPATRARVNRDDTRAMVHPAYAGKATEDATTTAGHAAVRALLRNGRDVIIDDTNLNGGNVKTLAKIAAQCGATVEMHDFPIDVNDAIIRDAQRAKPVGADVIRRMHDRYLAHLKGGFPAPPNPPTAPPVFKPYEPVPGTPRAVIVDIDGTLAHNYGHRSFYDYGEAILNDGVHQPVLSLLTMLMASGCEAIVMSGRDDSCRDLTVQWLASECGLGEDEYVGPFMRATGDKRDDALVKLELFDEHVRDYFDVAYVLDDRDRVVRAWRSVGLTVLQVADGDF